ncbi:MAG: hypothetical protein QMD53_05955 [Actinomycetota bacterium]|nr:hypothetical protein [Actinomycetota bacterium]
MIKMIKSCPMDTAEPGRRYEPHRVTEEGLQPHLFQLGLLALRYCRCSFGHSHECEQPGYDGGFCQAWGGLPPIFRWIEANAKPELVITMFLTLFFVVIITAIIASFADGAIIGTAHDIETKQKAELEESLKYGWYNWFYLLLMDLLLWVPTIAVFTAAIFLLIAFFIAASTRFEPGATLLLIFIFLLLIFVIYIVVFTVLATVQLLAHRVRVAQKKGIFDSIRGGFRLFRSNIGDSIIVWLLTVAVGLVIFFPIFFSNTFGSQALMLTKGKSLIIYVAYGLFLLAMTTVGNIFMSNFWTVFYEAVVKKEESLQIPLSSVPKDLPTR